MVPVLVRDARRLTDAQRCRPGRPPSRVALMRAATSGVLDRALDVAAALEVRGYGRPGRPPRPHRPWSRHDIAFAASAVAVLMLSVGARVFDLAPVLGLPDAARAGRRRHRRGRGWPRGLRAAAVCGSPRGAAMSDVLELDRVSYWYPDAQRPALDGVSLTIGAGELVVLAGLSGSGQVDAVADAPAGWCHISTAASWPGPSSVAGMDTRTRTPAQLGGCRRHAVPGPRDAGRDERRACRAGIPAREPRRLGAGGRARRRGGGARAGDRASARSADVGAVGR